MLLFGKSQIVWKKGTSVLIFPEGKTTSGCSVEKFHPRLLQSAIDCKKHVQPLALKYSRQDGSRIKEVSFHGDVTFLQSLWRTVCVGKINASLVVLEALSVNHDRGQLAQQAETQIRGWVEIKRR